MAGDDLACILSSVAFRVADQGLCRRFNMEVVAPALGVDSLIVRTAQASELACDKAMACLIQRCACGLSLPLICGLLRGHRRVLQIQRIPTFRCHLSGTGAMGLVHCDADYGHQPSEINFWLPLCTVRTAATLRCTPAAVRFKITARHSRAA